MYSFTLRFVTINTRLLIGTGWLGNQPTINTKSGILSIGKNYHLYRMKKQTKTTHGGKRKGSGRKPKYKEETTTIAFRVPKSLVEKVKKYVRKLLDSHEKITPN